MTGFLAKRDKENNVFNISTKYLENDIWYSDKGITSELST